MPVVAYRLRTIQTTAAATAHKRSETPITKNRILRRCQYELPVIFSRFERDRRCGSRNSTSLLAPLTNTLLRAKPGRSVLTNADSSRFADTNVSAGKCSAQSPKRFTNVGTLRLLINEGKMGMMSQRTSKIIIPIMMKTNRNITASRARTPMLTVAWSESN